jgi:two-component sensor histidine kinase/HAMP domain-containing protein
MLSKWINACSIKSKLINIVMISSCLGLIVAGTAFIVFDRISFKQTIVHKMETLADIIGSNCTASITFDNRRDATETLDALAAEKHILSANVRDKTGAVFAFYNRVGQNFDLDTSYNRNYGYEFKNDFIVFHRPIYLENEIVGSIALKADLEELKARLRYNVTVVAIIIMIVGLLTLVLVTRLQKFISDPVLKLASLAEQISKSKDYTLRAPKESHDEVGKLVETFNAMLSEIHERDMQLLHAQDRLEMRVLERTTELEKEIQERRSVEDKIRESLAEKEVLLKEIHHRVKNNLQVITSLLNLQSRKIKDPTTLEMFRDSQGRVKSMALIHEKLYRSSDLSRINFADYADNLAKYLLTSFKMETCIVRVQNMAEPIYLSVDTAVPCGLILNELISNCLKHAFTNRSEGQITIKFYHISQDEFVLQVSDNGVGIPGNIDYMNTTSLGMQLVNTLTSQLDGKIELLQDMGTTFAITFSEPKYKKARVENVA